MHEYLSKNNIPLDVLPENYCSIEDPRQEYWKELREKYGFDEREVWNFNDFFFVWFFEHLSMFNERNNVATDSDYEKIIISENETLSFQQAIDELLDISKWFTLNDGLNLKGITFSEFNELWKIKYKRFMLLFKETLPKLWW